MGFTFLGAGLDKIQDAPALVSGKKHVCNYLECSVLKENLLKIETTKSSS